MTEFHYGRLCKRHPELNGKRYKKSYSCIQCCKEYYSGIEREKKITMAEENAKLSQKLAKAEKILREIKKRSPAYATAIDAFLNT